MVFSVEECLRIKDNFAQHAHIPSNLIVGKKPLMRPRFTVAIPTYKRVATLKDTISSALSQTFKNFNIIVVDNNPEREDETELYMKSLNHEKIQYYKNAENLQMFGNWNRCALLSNADYFILIHDDDIMLPDFLSDCDRLLNETPDADVIGFHCYTWRQKDIDERIPTIKYNYKDKFFYWKPQKFIAPYIRTFTPTGVLLRKDKVIKIGGWENDSFPVLDLFFEVKVSPYFNVYLYEKVEYIYRWAVNESIKVDNIRKWIDYEPELIKYVSRKLHIPSLISDAKIKLLVDFRLSQLKTMFPDYYASLDLSDFNVPTTRSQKKRCIVLVKYAIRFFKIKKYLFHKL